jgi:hypothetical protein
VPSFLPKTLLDNPITVHKVTASTRRVNLGS